MKRAVRPEILDALPAADPRAIRSRRDLRRVNAWMGNHRILSRVLQSAGKELPPGRITELGAGDGQFLLRVARELSSKWSDVEVALLDQRDVVDEATLAEFKSLHWNVRSIIRDVREWVHGNEPKDDAIVTNLFLHHFSDDELPQLLRGIASRARLFVALEPRRGSWPLFCSRLLWMIGCNGVTCYDAPVSVRAGFADRELSALWPSASGWELRESKAGAFSHLFMARRKD
jgi:hypothetical protein